MNCKLSALLSTFLLAACGGDQKTDGAHPAGTHVHADGTVHTDEPAAGAHEHSHADRVALGEVKVGDHVIAVFQIAKIELGKEGDFDLDFPAGKALPSAVRGWIGVESAQGSLRVRFEKETDSRMHGHPEVPNPLPEGSKLWLEIEGAGGASKASVAFRN